ncbi:hypothetical protein RYX36_018968, partial [Vicia faba]
MNEEIAPTNIGVIANPTNFTASSTQERHVIVATKNYETTCWGCGLRLLLPSHAPVFKCGWCGAITNQSKQRCDKQGHRWRQLRDRCILTMVFMFMHFLIFGGVGANYPVVYSFTLFGIFHSIITLTLAVATISSFSLSAFRCAGTPPNLVSGSYPTVGNGVIANPTNFTASSTQERHVTVATKNYETTCWGCGLRLLLPSHAPVFKCGWCGAITNQSKQRCDKPGHRWRQLRDRCILTMVFMFMHFLIFGGVGENYPVVYSFTLFGIFHSIITLTLAVATISSFSLSAFCCAGTPPNLVRGSYPTVGN